MARVQAMAALSALKLRALVATEAVLGAGIDVNVGVGAAHIQRT